MSKKPVPFPEKLPKESDLDYTWFQIFCLLGYDRSQASVTNKILATDPTSDRAKIARRISKISSCFSWTERCQQYDVKRLTKVLDSAIEEQEKVESEWVDRYSDSIALCRDILRQNVKIWQCNELILDAVMSRLETETNPMALGKIQRIVTDISTANLNILKTNEYCLQFKDNTDALVLGQRKIEAALAVM